MNREEREFVDWLKAEAEYRNLLPVKTPINHSVKLEHDFINIYKYGESQIKVVFVKKSGKPPKKKQPISTSGERRKDSIARAKRTVNEIALCNDFTYFTTFTQNKELRDRFDLEAFRKDLARFVRNENRGREKKIKYLLIPEKHKDGAYHMHGLIMGLEEGKDLVINEHNHLDWIRYRARFGFFSCSKIKDKMRCANYVTKYITKSVGEFSTENKAHAFFASQGLKRRETVLYQGSPYDWPIEWDYENDYCKIAWFHI